MTLPIEQFVDASGLECPEPVRLTALAIKRVQSGEVVKVLSTDPVSPIDLQAWCTHSRHEFLSAETCDEGWLVRIKKCGD